MMKTIIAYESFKMSRVIKGPCIALFISCCFALTSVSANDVTRSDVLSYNARKAIDSLEGALGVYDEIPTLERSKWISRDQKSAKKELDNLIQKSIDLFESSTISHLRNQYRKLELKVVEEQAKLAEYRSDRVLAVRDDRSLRTRLMPGETLKSFMAVSKADYDMLIEVTQANIADYQTEMTNTMTQMSSVLAVIGIDLNAEQLEALMSSVVGDDIIQMTVVFNAVKDITVQLAQLTEQTGEDLVHAKKYYGMVVVLHQLIANMQSAFIAQVDQLHLPKLNGFRKDAQDNIKESRGLLKSGGNAATLNSNIRANELTLKVVSLYETMLKQQRAKVVKAYKVSEQEIQVANNTYKTVSLSSAVAGLIQEGTRTFEHLIALQMPDVSEFQNNQIREEFKSLTARMQKN